jgi:hypothetical protein
LWWLIDAERAKALARIALVQSASRHKVLIKAIPRARAAAPAIAAAAKILPASQRRYQIFATVLSPLFQARIDHRPIAELFNGRVPTALSNVIPKDGELLQAVLRKLVLMAMLTSIGQFGAEKSVSEMIGDVMEADEEWVAAPLASREFADAVRCQTKHLLSIEKRTGRLVVFRASVSCWNVVRLQREVVMSFWATEAQSQIFWCEKNRERLTIQTIGALVV